MNLRKITLCDEIIKLRDMLDAKGVEWTDASTIESDEHIERMLKQEIPLEYCDTTVYRTHFEMFGLEFSVINGYSTYGGYSPTRDTNDGLLEFMGLSIDNYDCNYGFLTAQDVFDKLKEIEDSMH